MRRLGTRRLATSSSRCGPPWRVALAVARVTRSAASARDMLLTCFVRGYAR